MSRYSGLLVGSISLVASVALGAGCLFESPSVNYEGPVEDTGPTGDASVAVDAPRDASDTSSSDAPTPDDAAMDSDALPSDGGDAADAEDDGGVDGGADGDDLDGGKVDAGPPRWVDFDIGRNFSCAVHSTGRIECWGDGRYSDKGNQDKSFADFTDVAVGDEHACALVAGSGEVICWGTNTTGQTEPDDLGPFDKISAGRDHTCGLKSNGKLRCWGDGFKNGGDDNFDANIPLDDTFRAFDAGGNLACAVHDNSDGEVECWYEGSAGDPTGAVDNSDAPFIAVTTNEDAFCALTKQFEFARCWGGDFGEDNNPQSLPFRSISMGVDHACGVKQDGTITCWGGFNDQGTVPSGTNFVRVKAHKWHTCGLTDVGKLDCWGESPYADAPAP